MIPINRDVAITWIDETDGTEFELTPLVGEVELDLYEASQKMSVDPAPFIQQAENEVDAEYKGKSWKKGQREKTIRLRAIMLASQSRGAGFSKDEALAMYRVIDSCVKSCKPKNGKKIEFNGNASKSFKFIDNSRLFTAIMELLNVDEDEQKN